VTRNQETSLKGLKHSPDHTVLLFDLPFVHRVRVLCTVLRHSVLPVSITVNILTAVDVYPVLLSGCRALVHTHTHIHRRHGNFFERQARL
jgi:hypothetical protein